MRVRLRVCVCVRCACACARGCAFRRDAAAAAAHEMLEDDSSNNADSDSPANSDFGLPVIRGLFDLDRMIGPSRLGSGRPGPYDSDLGRTWSSGPGTATVTTPPSRERPWSSGPRVRGWGGGEMPFLIHPIPPPLLLPSLLTPSDTFLTNAQSPAQTLGLGGVGA